MHETYKYQPQEILVTLQTVEPHSVPQNILSNYIKQYRIYYANSFEKVKGMVSPWMMEGGQKNNFYF
ncbi:MAG: hypothetical protein ACK42K_03790 [Leptonema sp. (in: bacteria)]